MPATLKISDGTTTISLLSGENGFSLNRWRPAVAQYKNGGTWQSSPLSGGRRLVNRQFANTIETFDLKVSSASSQDDIIYNTQELRRLLEKAVNYWTSSWQKEPVWVEAQATCETNPRYALIHSYSTPDDDNPFSSPFLQPVGAVMDRWGLIVERGHWLSDEPGTASCVEVTGAAESEDGGIAAFYPLVSADDCYVTNVVNTITLNAELLIGTGANTHGTGIRFRDVTIPQGATISSAWVRFQAEGGNAPVVDVDISCEDEDDSAVFATYANFVGRTRTAASVNWTPAAWTNEFFYDTPNIDTEVQEVVDRAEWESGNNLTVLIDDNASVGLRQAGSVDTEPSDVRATLFVTYEDSDIVRGKSRTCDGDAFIGNKQTLAQLTHIFVDDGGTVSTNDIGSTDFELLLPNVQQNDAVYFGIANNATDPGPFCSLVFNIGTAQANLEITWEYWDGGAWDPLTVQDNTNDNGDMAGEAFDTTGVGTVHWQPPSDWTSANVNTIDGYWVRALVTNVPAGPVSPAQQTDQIYTIIWGHYRVDDGDAEGDIPLLVDAELENVSSGGGALVFYSRRLLAGLRSDVRGTDFAAYLNLADRGNSTGITLSVAGDPTTSFVNRLHAPTGRAALYNPAGVAAMLTRIDIEFNASILAQYFGIFHVFGRVYQTGGAAGDFAVRLFFDAGIEFYSNTVTVNSLGEFEVLDFGRIELPSLVSLANGEEIDLLLLDVQASNSNGTPGDLYFYDLIFLPIDEWAGDFTRNNSFVSTLNRTRFLEIDSVINPRQQIRALLKETADGPIFSSWRTVVNGEIIHQANADQKMWTFGMYTSGTGWVARPETAHGIDVDAARRYLSMRGAR